MVLRVVRRIARLVQVDRNAEIAILYKRGKQKSISECTMHRMYNLAAYRQHKQKATRGI